MQETKKRRGAKREVVGHMYVQVWVLRYALVWARLVQRILPAESMTRVTNMHFYVLIIIIFFAFFTLFCWFFMENVPQLIQLIFDFQAQCPSWCATLENEADAMPDFGSEPRHDDEEEGYAGANEGKYGRNYHC